MKKKKRKATRTALWFGGTAVPLSLVVIVAAVVVVTAGATVTAFTGFNLATLFGQTASGQPRHLTPSHSPSSQAQPGSSASPAPSASPSPSSNANGGAPGGKGSSSGGGSDKGNSGNGNSTANGTSVAGGDDVDVIGSTSSVLLSVAAGGGNSAAPLNPGSSYPLNLSFSNQGQRAVTVSHIVVSVASVSAPTASAAFTCTVSDFYVTQIPTAFSITLAPSGGQTFSGQGTQSSNWPVVGMLNTTANQDGCKGATLTLGYTAWGSN